MMGDTRLEKMAAINHMRPDINASYIDQCEAAGLLVIDPDALSGVVEYIDKDLRRAGSPIGLASNGELTGYGEIVRNAIRCAVRGEHPLPCEGCGAVTAIGAVDDDGDFYCTSCVAVFRGATDA